MSSSKPPLHNKRNSAEIHTSKKIKYTHDNLSDNEFNIGSNMTLVPVGNVLDMIEIDNRFPFIGMLFENLKDCGKFVFVYYNFYHRTIAYMPAETHKLKPLTYNKDYCKKFLSHVKGFFEGSIMNLMDIHAHIVSRFAHLFMRTVTIWSIDKIYNYSLLNMEIYLINYKGKEHLGMIFEEDLSNKNHVIYYDYVNYIISMIPIKKIQSMRYCASNEEYATEFFMLIKKYLLTLYLTDKTGLPSIILDIDRVAKNILTF